jgi:large subunit ribosomal protein L25
LIADGQVLGFNHLGLVFFVLKLPKSGQPNKNVHNFRRLMKMTVLKADLRIGLTKSTSKDLRKRGRVPAVIYSADAINQNIHIDQIEFNQVVREQGRNSLLQVQVSGGEVIPVMIKEVQKHQLKEQLIHVDFKKVNINEPVTTTVPISLLGEAQGVRNGGVMQFQLRQLHIRCLPSEIPDSVPIYISDLQIGESACVGDLDIPDNVELQHESDEVIVSIAAPRMQPVEELEEEMNEDIAEPEIVGAKDGPGMDEAK